MTMEPILVHSLTSADNCCQQAGTTRFSTGFPVTLYDDSDNSLLGTLRNGINNYLLDTPEYGGAPLDLNTNARNSRYVFNTASFTTETSGQVGECASTIFPWPRNQPLRHDAHEAAASHRVERV
jgi:hypothetical protein